jgi:hypothetical protein
MVFPDDPRGSMLDEEQVVAEQNVSLHDRQTLSVRISRHAAEEFWRVQVSNPGLVRGSLSTTVGDRSSFLTTLIEEAIGGHEAAWHQLAQWGQANLTRPATGFRTRPV